MELTFEQIAFIRQDILNRGITMDHIAESLIDHICCSIENDSDVDFQVSYEKAIAAFGNEGLKSIEKETLYLLNLNKEKTMKKMIYLTGYIAVVLSTTGLLFSFLHWKGAVIMLIMGIIILNFGFLPMFFYNRYKRVTA